jgi:hypothetical protein
MSFATVVMCWLPALAAAATGPIGWWKLNETSGTTAADSSGNGNPGAIGSGVTLGIPGAEATAFGFNHLNSDSRVTVPYGSGDLAPATTQITVSAWINPQGDWTCGFYYQCAVVSNEGFPGDNTWGYGLRVIFGGTTLQWCWGTEGGPGDCAYGTYAFPLGTWTNIVGTYDGAVLRAYVNGVLVAQNVNSFPALNTTRDLLIGRLPSGGLPWNGGIDDVRVYDRVVTATELQQLAHLLPEMKEQCKLGGWVSYGIFKNQGDCVSFIATAGRNLPAQ